MHGQKFLDPKNDMAFKRIFGTEKNKPILIRFLNDILDCSRPIESVTFLKTTLDPEVAQQKLSIVDVLAQDDRGRQYVVEMQVAHNEGFDKRAQYYAARAYVNQIKSAGKYKNLNSVIFLAITDFVMFPDKPDFLSHHVTLDRKHYTRDLKDFSYTFVELPKFTKCFNELASHVDRWVYFLKHAPYTQPDELEKLTADAEILGGAYRALDQFYWTEDELYLYERQERDEMDAQAIIESAEIRGEKRGERRGERKGEKKGIKKGVMQTAKNMLALGIETKVIVAATGLAPDEVEDMVSVH